MAQVITIAGERLFALKAQNNEQLDIDTFIFANVPGQDPNATIDRNEGLPPVAQRVHQQIVQQVGRINDNVVVYSTVLDSVTGPFDFNWVGLYSSANQTLIAVSHIPSVSKTITVPGAAGNTLNRNFGIEYSGIADLAGITVQPETWQLDFTARLSGMDELTRQLAADMNGKDWFIEDGFKVVPRSTTNTFKVTPGAGYVSGLRVELKQDHILTLQSYPQFVYVDAWFDGDASSKWAPKTAFTVTNGEMDDYIDVNGKQHYVFKLARINAADVVEDLRGEKGLKEEINGHIQKLDEAHRASAIKTGKGNNIEQEIRNIRFNGDHSDHGNTVTPLMGNDLRKLGKVIKTDPLKSFMNIDVESPVVFWDEYDGYFHMVFTGYGDGSGEVKASPCHAKSTSLVDNWIIDDSPLLSASEVEGSPDEYGGTGPYIVKHENIYYLFYIGLTEAGYEAGTKTLCLATSPSISTPVWTRHGTVIGLGTIGTKSAWRSLAIWHPSIVKRDDTWYLFFNASGDTGSGDKERIGYAISNDLINWTVKDENCPLVSDIAGSWHDSITGDPSVYRQGNFWFMQFFGAGLGVAQDGIAYTTDAEFPLNWRVTQYSPTLKPTPEGNIDDAYSHKPFVFFNGGTKYHYYTSVSTKQKSRDISVAISGAELANKHYASEPMIKKFTTPGQGYSLHRFESDDELTPTYDLVHDARTGLLKIERLPANGFTAIEMLRFDMRNGGGTRLFGQSDNVQVNTVPDGNTLLSLFAKFGDLEVNSLNTFMKSNNYYVGEEGVDKFSISGTKAFQLVLQSSETGNGKSGLLIKQSINTPVADHVISWDEKWLWDGTKKGQGYKVESIWMPISINTIYTFAHGLGRTPDDFKIQFSSNAGERIIYEGWGYYNGSWRFIATDDQNTYIDGVNISVKTGGSLNAGSGAKPAATHMRILAN
ncbi:phage tail protein [Shewanella ulleungensis]|uniref:phage tail-collar fiber domain-containing protein n=1 Tax=Shewanella ulleungensis TaxID=2282699 RepID=UPI003D7BACCC